MKHKVDCKKIHFKTFGCKVNQYETQVARELFLKAGFSEGSRNDSDIYVINSCSLTKNTDRKVKQSINEIRRLNPNAKIFVMGCGVFNPESGLREIKDIEIFADKDKRQIFNKITGISACVAGGISGFEGRQRAFVKVQDGCNNFCSYCVVPYLRGKPVSRPEKEILNEIKNLLDNRFKEIILCGINLGLYGCERGGNLTGLLKKIAAFDGEFRIRLSSIEPNHVTKELIDLMADNPKMCPHFHLPLQSGDDVILKIMNRRYSTLDYFSLIDRVRKKVKDAAFTTDILVGFPQEKEENFKNTLLAIGKGDFLKAHVFSYSRRDQTASAKLDGHLQREIVIERRKEAEEKAFKVSYNFRKKFLNKPLRALIEKRRNILTARHYGFTDNYIEIQLKAVDVAVNDFREIKITDVRNKENLAFLINESE
ncbi:MAG: tRNA (N(6)-L-threonylcarbamoyladenosine(37)-C(2))-methylthiotransferase MtaB [Candidatus Omnitrophota bacterium]